MPRKRKPGEPSAMSVLPINSSNALESDTWYYQYICYLTSDGDLDNYDKLYYKTDWSKVYNLYVLRGASQYG